MKTEIMKITPEMAHNFLLKNSSNRPIRQYRIEEYMDYIKRNGKLEVTPDAIAFDSDGNLLNGQHRLSAIKNTGITCELIVFNGMERKAFAYTDRGSKRTISDLTGYDKRIVQVAELMMQYGMQNRHARQDAEVFRKVIDNGISAKHSLLVTTKAKYFYSAPVRAINVAMMINGFDMQSIAFSFKRFVNADIDNMTDCEKYIFKRYATGHLSATQSKPDTMTVFYAVNIGNAQGLKKPIINETTKDLALDQIKKAVDYLLYR